MKAVELISVVIYSSYSIYFQRFFLLLHESWAEFYITKKTSFPDSAIVLFSLELCFVWYTILPVILWILKSVACPYLGASNFGHTPLF